MERKVRTLCHAILGVKHFKDTHLVVAHIAEERKAVPRIVLCDEVMAYVTFVNRRHANQVI